MPEVSIPKPKRKLGALSYLMILAAVVVLLIAAAYGLWHAAASSKLSAALEKARERDEPVWFADIEPAPVDPALDGGPLYLAAMSQVVEPDERFYAVYDAATNDGSGTVPAAGGTVAAGPGDHLEFRQAIQENAEALALLREAMAKPYCRIKRDYKTKQPFMILLEDVQHARNLARVLQADVLQSLGTGQHERALEAIDEMFGLAECLREEPFLVSQMVRMAIGGVAVDSIETALQHGDLSDEQFARLDARLKAVEATVRLKNSMLAERSAVMTTIEHLGEQRGTFDEFDGPMRWLSVRPLVLEQQAFVLEVMGQIGENADQPGPAGMQAAQELEDAVQSAPARFVHVKSLVPAAQAARTAGLRYRQQLINARLGLRVHRFRAAEGKLPGQLQDVLDAGLNKLPGGIFSGKPLVYRTADDSFRIYAVGANGTDDGGAMQPDHEEGGTLFHVDYAAGQQAAQEP